MCDGQLLAAFEPTTRDSDVFVSTTAKCGQTWLQTLLFHLKTRGRSPDLHGKGLPGVSPWLEIPTDSGIIEPTDRESRLAEFEALEDPRVFKLHVIWDEIPRPEGSRAKIMTVTRDPRDVPYSMYCHLRSLKRKDSQPTDDFDAYFERWFKLGFYFKFVRSFWPHQGDPDVLWLSYEEMHADLPAVASQIVSFLQWDLSTEDIERALPLVDFEYMQKSERSTILKSQSDLWDEKGQFFREGAVGKNRAKLSAKQEQRIVERAQRELGPECCKFIFRSV